MVGKPSPEAGHASREPERRSLLNRLSLSPSKREVKRPPNTPVRSTRAVKDNPAAGPSHEHQSATFDEHQAAANLDFSLGRKAEANMPPAASPPTQLASRSTSVNGHHTGPALSSSKEPKVKYNAAQSGNPAAAPTQSPNGYRQMNALSGDFAPGPGATSTPTSDVSPPRPRQPIYPALASPPRRTLPPSPPSSTPERWARNTSIPATGMASLSIDTSPASANPRRKSSPRVNATGSPVSSSSQQTSMQIIASSAARHDRSPTSEKQGHRYDKQGRPMISARRSATSSSRTVTRADIPANVSSASPTTAATGVSTYAPSPATGQGLSEASAYAKAVTSTLSRPNIGAVDMRARSAEIPPTSANTPLGGRPLPRPPTAPLDRRKSSEQSASDSVLLHKSPQTRPAAKQSASKMASNAKTASSPSKRASAIDFNFPRSPTIAALVDPRQNSIPQERSSSQKALAIQLSSEGPGSGPPLKIGLARDRPAGRTLSLERKAVNGAALIRPSSSTPLHYLLAHPSIQVSFLSVVSINAFLSLTGSSEVIRHQFTGESVGRWVLREWGVQPHTSEGSRWPNLTVWEGFLESLLHDPATYSTYPARWHNLLRHLSLSHSLVILFLRNLPPLCFPNHALLPFEDEGPASASIPFSPSSTSLASLGQPRSRVGSMAGSDSGSLAPSSKPPKRERVVEIVMPEPLAAHPTEEVIVSEVSKPMRRRGSISSLASAASFSFGRRRSNSASVDTRISAVSSGTVTAMAEPTASMAPGKGHLPPVSFPSAKRYGFKHPNEGPGRTRHSSMGQRPGSIFSMQTNPSVNSYAPRASSRGGDYSIRSPFSPLQPPLAAPPPIGVRPRSSFGSNDSNRRSDREQNSPIPGRRSTFPVPQAPRCEPAFDRPMPYIPGRAPILRVFVPLSETVRRWPSAEGAVAALEELGKCGALKRMRLGDLIVNTAIRAPRTTEHVLVFVPFVKHQLVPLQYVHVSTGHLPSYVDAFALPPSYYYPFLPAPQVIYLNLGPYREQGLRSMRLASDRRDMTIASGAKITAKRYLFVAGVEIGHEAKAAKEWQGMVSLEAEGTAEGKADLEQRFGTTAGAKAPLAPWEIVKEKSMGGTVWLRLVKERS